MKNVGPRTAQAFGAERVRFDRQAAPATALADELPARFDDYFHPMPMVVADIIAVLATGRWRARRRSSKNSVSAWTGFGSLTTRR